MYDKIIEMVRSNFGNSLVESINYRSELTLVIDKLKIKDVCSFLFENEILSFELLVDICGLDRNTDMDRFEIVYNLWSFKNKTRLRLRVKVDEKDLHVSSVTSIWESASFYERETYDFYGIIFDDHPDLRRIYMPEEFEYYPLRKDFPLMGIPDSIPLPRK